MITQKILNGLFRYFDGDLYRIKSAGGKMKDSKAGFSHNSGYLALKISGLTYLTHRVIFLLHHGYMPAIVDHIDGNPLNNKIENLRECTISQNGHNRKLNKNSSHGVKGVRLTTSGKWQVRLSIDKKMKQFGSFEDLELAELVAIEARNKYHGNFARHA